MDLTNRTRIEFRYSTSPAAVGYGTEEERAKAMRDLLAAPPDAVGTLATLPARIDKVLQTAGLSRSGTYRRYDLRVGSDRVLVADLQGAMRRLGEDYWPAIDQLTKYAALD